MTLEATLSRIDSTLSSLLLIAQTSAAAAHTFGAVADAASAVASSLKTPRMKATKEAVATTATDLPVAVPVAGPLGLVDGDPEGTRYWLIEAHNTVYAEHPGQPPCTVVGAVITTAAEFLSKKAEFAKKSVIPPATVAATTAPAAAKAETAGPALTASSPAPTVSFKQVVDSAMALAKDPREGRGRGALMDILAKYLPDAPVADRKVGKLEAVGKNAEILATLSALLANDPVPVAVVEAEEDIFA